MDSAVRSYIVRILLLHVAFLIAVATVIALAGLTLYSTARADAQSAELERVAVPVNQTKDLLERHFQAIFDTLRLANRPDGPAGAWPHILNDASDRDLWGQLRGHLGGLLEVDPSGLRVVEFRSDPASIASSQPNSTLGPQSPRPVGSPLQSLEQGQLLVNDAAEFLEKVARGGEAAVSGVYRLDGAGQAPVVLAVLPITGGSGEGEAVSPATTRASVRALLIGVVPVSYLEENFLLPAGQSQRSGLLLFDSSGRLVAGGGEALAGRTVEELSPRQLPVSLASYVRGTVSGGTSDSRLEFDGRIDIAASQFQSALATASPVRVGDRTADSLVDPVDEAPATSAPKTPFPARPEDDAGSQPAEGAARAPGQEAMWLIALVNREAVVAPLAQTARTAILWAAAMVGAITVILLSSAIQLIRGRSRLESLRNEMINRELREARQIQLMWLPRDTVHQPATRQMEIAAENIPASHISGDFYNFFDMPDGRTALVIGDVTGHGLVAAFLMATTQLLMRTTLQRLSDPGKALEEVNNQLCSQSYHGQFVTIQLIIIDEIARQILASSAGHPPPLACGRDGKWRALPLEPQLVLGVMAESTYPTVAISLEDCQALLLYTDGVIEVKNAREQRFNLDQLLVLMNRHDRAIPSSAKDLVAETFAIVRGFAGDVPQDDDLTLVAVHLTPQPAPLTDSRAEPGRPEEGISRQAAQPAAGARRSL